MSDEFLQDGIHSNSNVIDHINEKEFNECILKLGAFISIIKSKKINQTQLFIELLHSKHIQDIFLNVMGIDTFEELVRELMVRYPILYKSKIVKNSLKTKNDNRKTKKHL
jgi:hypothetical protein